MKRSNHASVRRTRQGTSATLPRAGRYLHEAVESVRCNGIVVEVYWGPVQHGRIQLVRCRRLKGHGAFILLNNNVATNFLSNHSQGCTQRCVSHIYIHKQGARSPAYSRHRCSIAEGIVVEMRKKGGGREISIVFFAGTVYRRRSSVRLTSKNFRTNMI